MASNWTSKKFTKVEKISPDDFLGLQQSLCNINSSFGIFMSKYQRKKLLKCTKVIAESIKQVDFDDLFLTAIFAQ